MEVQAALFPERCARFGLDKKSLALSRVERKFFSHPLPSPFPAPLSYLAPHIFRLRPHRKDFRTKWIGVCMKYPFIVCKEFHLVKILINILCTVFLCSHIFIYSGILWGKNGIFYPLPASFHVSFRGRRLTQCGNFMISSNKSMDGWKSAAFPDI